MSENHQAVEAPLVQQVMPAATKPRKRLTAKQKRMQGAIRYLRDYMATYEAQAGCLNYTDKTLIDDVLYGLGVALDPRLYQYASGYSAWKEKLREHLAVDCGLNVRGIAAPTAQDKL